MNSLKMHLLGGLLLAPALAFAQAPFTYTIKGQMGKLDAPAKIYLLRGLAVDSATLHHGAFAFKGTTDVPMQADLVVERRGHLQRRFPVSMNRTQVFLEPSLITVTTPDSLPHATIKGGRFTADFQQLQAQEQPVVQKRIALGPKGTPEQFAALNRELDQIDFAFIKAHPNSWVSLENLQVSRMTGPLQYPVAAPLYAGLSPELKNSAPGREYAAMLQRLKAVSVGAVAPAFTQPTPEGKSVSLADYRGKYVLVDFWASWCKPCRAESPAIIQVYNQYKNRNFEVLGISLDKDKAKWVQAIADDHLPWTQVSDLKFFENEVVQRYNINAIPQNFLIDPAGKIVAVNLKGAELNATLDRLLK